MSIVVWGFKDGTCIPLAGKGFRREFSGSSEAEMFIKYQCNNISVKDVHRYRMYITDEFIDMDQMLNHHHFTGTQCSFRQDNKRVENVDILAIKELVDLDYQLHLSTMTKGKLAVDRELRSMSNEQLRRQQELVQQIQNMMRR